MFNSLKASALAFAIGLGAWPSLIPITASAATAEAGPTVQIDNFVFGPQTLTVKAGTTVTWVNRDDVPHAVIANGKGFKSKIMDTGERFSFTFVEPGDYDYFCSLHPHMVGKVIVKAG